MDMNEVNENAKDVFVIEGIGRLSFLSIGLRMREFDSISEKFPSLFVPILFFICCFGDFMFCFVFYFILVIFRLKLPWE